MLKQVKVKDKVKCEAHRVSGQITVAKIQRRGQIPSFPPES
jgi:hypothetical protein